ncbi:MAG: hypothetical protein ACT4UQ_06295 [Gammaproteobacteria bacterium]
MTRLVIALALCSATAGSQEIVREQRAGSPWPAVTIVTFVEATPEEAAAVFTDYARHVEFIPSTKLSRISKVHTPSDVEVDYIVALPIVSDERYTVRDRLSRDGSGYRVDWTLVRASSTKGTVGHARFTSTTHPVTGKPGTRFEYHNFVTPGSRIAGMGFIRNRALKEMEQTAAAFAARFESERSNTAAMQARIASLRAAVYQAIP